MNVEETRADLLAKGYHKDLVEAGLEWAQNSAKGMAKYVAEGDPNADKDALFSQFHGRYLNGAEDYVRKMAE